MYKISVIIPYYNIDTELFKQCYQSILAQNYRNYELIIVDDGSEKRYAEYLDTLHSDTLAACRIIHSENHGVSFARNLGLEHAKGDYITFVDGDDILSPYMFSEAMTIADKNSADVVVGCIKKVSSVVSMKPTAMEQCRIYQSDKDRDEIVHSIFEPEYLNKKDKDDWMFIMQAPVAKFIKRDLARKVFFPVGIAISEDTIWNYDLFSGLDWKLAALPAQWYLYMYNSQSAVHHYSERRAQDILHAVNLLNNKIAEQYGLNYRPYMRWLISKLQQIITNLLYARNENQQTLFQLAGKYKDLISGDEFKYLFCGLKGAGIKFNLKIRVLKSRSAVYYYYFKQTVMSIRGNNCER